MPASLRARRAAERRGLERARRRAGKSCGGYVLSTSSCGGVSVLLCASCGGVPPVAKLLRMGATFTFGTCGLKINQEAAEKAGEVTR